MRLGSPSWYSTRVRMADPTLPDTVEYEEGTFLNAQGLQLRTYRFSPKGRAARGVIWLCHGYASWTNFEWMLASEPGGSHTVFEDSVPGGLVAAGFTVATLDHQSHGRSEGDQGLRCFFNRFDDLADECLDCLSKLREEDATLDTLPVFLFGISMGGATAVRMAQKQPTLFRGAVLYAPMLSLEEVQKQSIFLCVTNRHLAPLVEASPRPPLRRCQPHHSGLPVFPPPQVLNKLIPKVCSSAVVCSGSLPLPPLGPQRGPAAPAGPPRQAGPQHDPPKVARGDGRGPADVLGECARARRARVLHGADSANADTDTRQRAHQHTRARPHEGPRVDYY